MEEGDHLCQVPGVCFVEDVGFQGLAPFKHLVMILMVPSVY